MTSENGYEKGRDYEGQREILSDIRRSVRSIDGKVEAILDELGEHFDEVRRTSDDAWPAYGFQDIDDDY